MLVNEPRTYSDAGASTYRSSSRKSGYVRIHSMASFAAISPARTVETQRLSDRSLGVCRTAGLTPSGGLRITHKRRPIPRPGEGRPFEANAVT